MAQNAADNRMQLAVPQERGPYEAVPQIGVRKTQDTMLLGRCLP